jgi:hypothetical protein
MKLFPESPKQFPQFPVGVGAGDSRGGKTAWKSLQLHPMRENQSR